MTTIATRRITNGFAILALATAACWGIVTVGQARGGDRLLAVIGAARMSTDAPLVETLFNLMIYGPILAIGVAGALADRLNPVAPGTRPAAGFVLGLIVGAAGLCVAVAYARIAGTLTDAGATGATARMLLWGAGLIAFQVAAEETFFRGWLQPALVARWGAGPAVVATAGAFAGLHLAGGARDPISLANLALGGVMFGLFALRSGGLAAAFGAHYSWNLVEQLGWGLDPNPGLGTFGAVVDKELVGPALWGGSQHGLNGSVAMTVALLAVVVPLLLVGGARRTAPSPIGAARRA